MRGFGVRTFIKRVLGLGEPGSIPGPMIGRQFSMAPVKDRFVARTLIDIGVAAGSPNIYAAFPDAYIVAIEPLIEFRSDIEEILADRAAEIILCAAGERSGEVTINVYPDSWLQSSLYKRNDFRGRPGEERIVPLRTLDEIVASRKLADPLFIKIDAEGSELGILKGARKALSRTSGIIVEVNLDDRYGPEGATLGDIEAFMVANGFSLVGILDAWVDDTVRVRKADLLYAPATGTRRDLGETGAARG